MTSRPTATPQLVQPPPPLVLSPAPSWSGVASQLKSLLVRSPLLTASLALVGVGSVMVAYATSERKRRRERERRRVMRLVRARFDECRLDILKYCFEQEWNRLSVAQLDQLYGAFSSLLSNPKRGAIPLTSLAGIIRAAGVSDDRVALACAKFFDRDGNWQVDFIELVERLNLAVFGSQAKKLAAYFSVFDLDRSGRISADEVKEVLEALGHPRPDDAVNALFLKADKVNQHAHPARAQRAGEGRQHARGKMQDTCTRAGGMAQQLWMCVRFARSASSPLTAPPRLAFLRLACVSLSVCALSPAQNHDGHIDLSEFTNLADAERVSFGFTNNVANHFGLPQIE